MKTNICDPGHLNSYLDFFVTYKQACDSNRIYDGAGAWCVKHSMTWFSAATLQSRLHLQKKSSLNKPERVLFY